MDREKQLLNLARRLDKATGEKDWATLSKINGELEARLTPPGDHCNSWNSSERRALAILYAAHRKALEQCTIELDRIGALLKEMRDNKEGWLAYAQSGDLEESEQR